MSNIEPVIIIKNLEKSFKLPHEQHNGIKQKIINIFKGVKGYETQHVLKDVSFEIKKGEFFGIVGRNGSGKSTLLKLISGIYTPDKGAVKVNGSLTPFIELGVGFNPELTGRENVFLNGALLGFSRSEMEAMYDDIVDFAELDKFMDQKLKNYSSGMQVRLAFSIAIRANTDILVLDEVLAVGDYNFQQKCFGFFRQLKKTGKTVVLVSHDANALQMFCTRAVLIEKGRVKKIGKTLDVLKEYSEQNMLDQEKTEEKTKNDKVIVEAGTGAVVFNGIKLYDEKNISKRSFSPNEKINISCTFKFLEDIKNPVFGLVIQDAEGGQPIFATNTLDKKIKTGQYAKDKELTVHFVIENIYNDGRYFVSGAVASSDRGILYVRFMNVTSFSSVGWQVTAKARIYHDYDFYTDYEV